MFKCLASIFNFVVLIFATSLKTVQSKAEAHCYVNIVNFIANFSLGRVLNLLLNEQPFCFKRFDITGNNYFVSFSILPFGKFEFCCFLDAQLCENWVLEF